MRDLSIIVSVIASQHSSSVKTSWSTCSAGPVVHVQPISQRLNTTPYSDKTPIYMQHIHILVHLKWSSAGAEIVIDAGGQCRIPLNILRVAECSQCLRSCPTTACRSLLHHRLEAHGPSFKHLLLLVSTLAHLARHLLLLGRTLAHLAWCDLDCTVPQSQGDPKIVKRGPNGDPVLSKKGTKWGPF